MSFASAQPLNVERRPERERRELAMAVAAMRGRLALVALLFALAGAAWWISAVRMDGMTTMGGSAMQGHAMGSMTGHAMASPGGKTMAGSSV